MLGGDARRCDTGRMNPDDRGARVIAANAGFEIVEVGERVIAAAVSGGVAGITLFGTGLDGALEAMAQLGFLR